MEGLREVLASMKLQQQQLTQQLQQQFYVQQQEFAKYMDKIFKQSSPSSAGLETKMETLANSITEFIYDPENGLTFDAWYVRYQGLFTVDAQALDDAAKVRLLLRKLSTPIHTQYVNFILPKEYSDYDFATTVKKLTHMFGKKISLFHLRYSCLNTTKSPQHDFQALGALINKRCEDFKISTITVDQFKCLMFVCALRSPADADIRTKVLHLIDTKSDSLTIEDLVNECERIINLKRDTSLVQNQKADLSTVALVQSKNFQKKGKFKNNQKDQSKFNDKKGSGKKPSTPCWFCGNLHYSKDCTFKTHKCQKCKAVGHRDGYCASSKKVKPKSSDENSETNVKTIHSVNQVLIDSSRKFIDIIINSKPVKLQLDTGSDISIISSKTWIELGKPTGTVSSHNGTQFISEKFQTYCLTNGIQHLRCPPFHPSSNGQAERFVDTFKRGLIKLQAGGNNPSSTDFLPIFLQCYRSTPNPNTPNKLSPAEELMGRSIRTSLDLLKPSSRQVSKNEKQLKQEMQYNRKHGTQKKEFSPGTLVFVQIHAINKWTWIPGEIVERVGKVIYNVLVPTRRRLVRAHANQLKLRHDNNEEKELPAETLFNIFDFTDTSLLTLQDSPQEPLLETLDEAHQEIQDSAASSQQQADSTDSTLFTSPQQQVDLPTLPMPERRELTSIETRIEHRESSSTESLPIRQSTVPIRHSIRSRRSPIKYKDYVCGKLKKGEML